MVLGEYINNQRLLQSLTITGLSKKAKVPKSTVSDLCSPYISSRGDKIYKSLCYAATVLKVMYALNLTLDNVIENVYSEVYDDKKDYFNIDIGNKFDNNIYTD